MLLLDRERFINKVRNGPTASAAAKVPQLVKAGPARVEGRDGPHVSIFHDVFARFQSKFNDISTPIPSQVYHDVTTLFSLSQTVYLGEKDRARYLGPVIAKLIKNDISKPTIDGAIPDGAVTTANHGRPTAYRAILEYKNEIGTGGSDPATQAAKGYEKAWAEPQVRHTSSTWCDIILNRHVRQIVFVHLVVVRASSSPSLGHGSAFSGLCSQTKRWWNRSPNTSGWGQTSLAQTRWTPSLVSLWHSPTR